MPDNYYAAADCGTNSFQLIVVKMNEDGSFRLAAREKEIIRLEIISNTISDNSIKKSILTLLNFKKIAKSYNAPLAVVATSAVRNAGNKNDFINKIFNMTGIAVRVLSGTEEAHLTYLGVSKTISFVNTILCVDIGGGSTEFIIGRGEEILSTKSLEIGAVKITRKFFNEDYSCSEEQINKAALWTETEIGKIKNDIEKINFEKVIGASGTIISAASMVTKGNSELNKYHLKREAVDAIAKKVFGLRTVEERKTIPGLEETRADIITAGLIILNTIYNIFNIDEMIISLFGLREGVIVKSFLLKH